MSDDNTLNWRPTRPVNEIDLNAQVINSLWGNPEIAPGLKERLKNEVEIGRDTITDDQGNQQQRVFVKREDLWSLLGFYTRDMRLANLDDRFSNELSYCQYHIDLANDFLKEGFIEPFLITLSRVATVLETSQSKRGFLRRQLNTFTSESKVQNLEPPKRNLFGVKKTEE